MRRPEGRPSYKHKQVNLHLSPRYRDAPPIADESLQAWNTHGQDFIGHVGQQNTSQAWKAFLKLSDALPVEESRLLNQSGKFIRKVHQFARRIDTAYFRGLSDRRHGDISKGDDSLPSPLGLAQKLRSMDLLDASFRISLLWRLGKGLMAARVREDYSISADKETMVLEQIVRLWHDTFASQIRPNEQQLGNTELQWSFLPPIDSFVSDTGRDQPSLNSVLSRVVPRIRPEDMVAEAFADYPSALMITLDMLKGNSIEPHTITTLKPEWSPLVSFLDGIIAKAARPTVPPTILKVLTTREDPTLAYYEAMIRRYDLQDIPPIRTDRGRTFVAFATTKLDEFGNPVNRKYNSTSLMNDIQDRAVTEGAQDVPYDEPSATPLDEFSKEALGKAGFSVSQALDMDPEVHKKVDDWLKRLGRSIEQTNLSIAEKCWSEVMSFNERQAGASSLPLYLYEHFMLAFLAMRQPNLAVDIWNTVIQAGLEPTVRTWTVLMRGCSRARDADSLESFWTRMRSQGIQPDAHAWSVRVLGLIKSRKERDALESLHAMGQEWIAALRTQLRKRTAGLKAKQRLAAESSLNIVEHTNDVGNVPRPIIAVMNSAVSGFAGGADMHMAKAIAWGRNFGIEPDLITYNALLNVAMRKNRGDEALEILKHMQIRNIQPDSTTFTVLLSALFQSSYFLELDAEPQSEKLFALITDIESSSPNAKLDKKGYALAIDRMLKLHSNTVAARALLEHMASRGLEPTAQIYTILMSSYFDASPPDFAAAEALWTRIRSSNSGYGAALDTIFYDRMVESYARHHMEVGLQPMLQFLDRMSKEGKRPSWRALELVARALNDRAEWARLAKLVDDVKETKGSVRLGARGLVGQNEFWRFVISTGVLRDEEIWHEKQVRKGVTESSFHMPGTMDRFMNKGDPWSK